MIKCSLSPSTHNLFFLLLLRFKSYSLFLNISAFLGVTSPVDILMFTLPHHFSVFFWNPSFFFSCIWKIKNREALDQLISHFLTKYLFCLSWIKFEYLLKCEVKCEVAEVCFFCDWLVYFSLSLDRLLSLLPEVVFSEMVFQVIKLEQSRQS